MADDGPDNLILRKLRKIEELLEALTETVGELSARMSSIERYSGEQLVQIGTTNSHLDRVDKRLARIERRLELVEEPSV